MTIIYRLATTDDIFKLSSLAKKSYIELYQNILTKENLEKNLDNNKSPQALLENLEQKNNDYIIALDDDKLIGYIGLRDPVSNFIGRLPTKKDQALNGIYIDSDYHRQGIGHALLNQAFKSVRFQQAENIYLFVWHENIIAYNFYLKYGFKIVGTEQIFNKGKIIGQDLVMMKQV